MIGICGVSMSALAYILKSEGHSVCGSDKNYEKKTKCLENIDVYKQPYLQGVKDADLIVKSSAISQNKETQLAEKLGKKIISRGELLEKIASTYEKVIAVAGSHGKTTTTAMIYHTLFVNGKNPTLHLGGDLIDVGNCVLGDKEYFITEACEYYDNFLFLHPYVSVITNIEPEHLDYFGTFKNELLSYKKFENNSQFCITINEFSAKNIRINKNYGVGFSLYKGNEKLDRINLKIGGKINVKNALFCTDVCQKLGLSIAQIKFGLESFKGVKKRCERVFANTKFDIFIDYAHHPKEIEESGKYFKKICKNKCIVAFQPHTYSRTKEFYKDFIKSLSIFDEVICYKTYPAREKVCDGLTEEDLFLGLKLTQKTCFHIKNVQQLKNKLKTYQKGDIVVFMGAGDLPDRFDFDSI